MLLARIRSFTAAHHKPWCWAGIFLILLQPFIAVHFRCDGLEDEPEFRLRSASETVRFNADDRADHPTDRETTLFPQTAARINLPGAVFALDGLLAIVLALLPLTVALVRLVEPPERRLREPVPVRSGAPPPARPWRRLPPQAAPPFRT